MSVIGKIKNFFVKEKANPTGAELYNVGQYSLGYSKKDELLREMRGWVYACVNAISDELANMKIILYERKGDEVEKILDDPILNTLYRVNDFTTKFDLFNQIPLQEISKNSWRLVYQQVTN